MRIKTAAVAGSFYPAEATELLSTVQQLLTNNPNTGPRPVALQVPHAGLRYSGGIAAAAYNRIRPYLSQFQRIVILGPAHRVGTDKMVTLDADAWQTPLGRFSLDKNLASELIEQRLLHYNNPVHAQEHCLEVQLPFLQALGLGHLPLLPIVVGQVGPSQVAQLIEQTLTPQGTLLLISSDLSHFHTQPKAIKIDGDTLNTIKQLQPTLGPQQACGCHSLNGLLEYARHHRLQAELLAQGTSADGGGDVNRVVGYSAFAFYPTEITKAEKPDTAAYSKSEQQHLLQFARQAIAKEFGSAEPITTIEFPGLEQQAACFVTLNLNHKLRGCIGNLEARDSLLESLTRNAKLAAFNDHRFAPLSREEFSNIKIELSILTPMQALAVTDEADLLSQLRPNIDGLVFNSGQHQATFLPSVWQQLPEPKQFLVHLKRKAGLAEDYWNADVQCHIYQSIKIVEA